MYYLDLNKVTGRMIDNLTAIWDMGFEAPCWQTDVIFDLLMSGY